MTRKQTAAGDAANIECCAASPHELRRLQVMSAAEACFARAGFHGASMQEICAEAQMSPGALYRYFRSKDEIIAAIAEDERRRNGDVLAQLAGDGDLCDRLVVLGLHHLEDMRRPGAAALMAEIVAEGLRNSDIGTKFLRNELEVRTAIRTSILDHAAAGRIAPIADIDAIMGFLCALIDGLVLRMAFEPDLTPDRIEPLMRQVVVSTLRPRPAVAVEPDRIAAE